LTPYRAVSRIAYSERPEVYRGLVCTARLRGWAGRRTVGETVGGVGDTGGTIVAKLADGPLSGSTRGVTAVEGRPPKTIDIDFGERRVRYCLSHWEQAGQSAIYGFLYDV
jgi:hypothetical protein